MKPCLDPPTCQMLYKKLSKILASKPKEEKVQQFFEQHPHLLPGLADYHNGPYAKIVITKFPLGIDFITDFAFISQNSQMIQLTLVELESPSKKLFRKDGRPSRDYIDARQQLTDWLHRVQQDKKKSVELFAPMLRRLPLRDYHISARAYLICGRRIDFKEPKAHERWSAESSLASLGLITMTYDRILESLKRAYWPLHERILVCSYSDRSFLVEHVTP